MNGIEPLADAMTGGVIGRALEPADGAVGSDGHTHESHCLNCRTPLVGDYCHACGQRGHVHRSLHAFGHDLLHGVFHFEGKIWRTLPLLGWRPGDLTRRYIAGERATFVSPIALFLFCVFLMFAVLGWTGMITSQAGENITQGIDNTVKEQRREIGVLEAQRAETIRRAQPTVSIDRKLASAREDLEATEAFRNRGEIIDVSPNNSANLPPWLRGAIQKVAKNPDLLIYKLKTNAYKYSWMLIPLSVPFMWLLFPFSRRFRLYDHTVFVTYSLCFMTVLGIVAMLLMKAGLPNAAGLLVLIPPWHWYRQLRGAYSLTRLGALWRTAMLVVLTNVTVSMFLMILVGLGVFE